MTPVFKKLNFKNQKQIHIINEPDSFKKELDAMKDSAVIKSSLSGAKGVEFFLAFVTKQKEVDDLANKVTTMLGDDGLLWFAYPKGTSKKYTCEFNRDNGWNVLGKAGFEPVRMVAIDEDWSALRFRKPEKIKKMTRNFAMSAAGKKKVEASTKTSRKPSTKKK